jgi:hypothetical protein
VSIAHVVQKIGHIQRVLQSDGHLERGICRCQTFLILFGTSIGACQVAEQCDYMSGLAVPMKQGASQFPIFDAFGRVILAMKSGAQVGVTLCYPE